MKYRVLCVEDETDFREDICEYLELKNYHVTQAGDGEMACRILNQSKRFDLVLCDIRMPGCNGYDVLRTLRMLDDERQHTPFIYLSAMSDIPDMLEGRARGCDEYLVKPLNLQVLEATVRGRIERDLAARFTEKSVRNGLHSRLHSLLMHDMALPFMELSHLSAQLQETVAEALPRKTMEKAGEIRRHAQNYAMRAQLIAGFDKAALQENAQPLICAPYAAQIAMRVFGQDARHAVQMMALGACDAVPQRELTLALSMLLELSHAQHAGCVHGMMMVGRDARVTIRIADRAEHLMEQEYAFHPWHDTVDVAAMGTALDGRVVPLLYAERLCGAVGGSLAVKSVADHYLVVELVLPTGVMRPITIPAIGADALGQMREALAIANENHYH